jgi:hypothetical protein
MSGHTPGPWTAVFEVTEPAPQGETGDVGFYRIDGADGQYMGATVNGEADAHLLAAAPLLLEALEATLLAISTAAALTGRNGFQKVFAPTLAKSNAAIAAAKGEV